MKPGQPNSPTRAVGTSITVGVGASVGGCEGLTELLAQLGRPEHLSKACSIASND